MTCEPGTAVLLYVLDTHVLIWYFTGSKRPPEALKNRIDQVRLLGGRLLVPTIVLAEALAVAAKGRVAFDFDQLYEVVLAEPEFEIVGFAPGTVMRSLQQLALDWA
jgi:predicted nucleic acid-binding protein